MIGLNVGDGVNSFTLPESMNESSLLALANTSNVGTPGVYIFRVDEETVGAPAGKILQSIVYYDYTRVVYYSL